MLSEQAALEAMKMLCSGDFSGSQQVAQELVKKGAVDKLVHRTTLTRHAKAAATRAGCPIRATCKKPVKQLPSDTKAKRMAFCKANKSRGWGSVMVTDRKKFLFRKKAAAAALQEWNQGSKRSLVTLLPGWPPNSPDSFPLRMYGHGCSRKSMPWVAKPLKS